MFKSEHMLYLSSIFGLSMNPKMRKALHSFLDNHMREWPQDFEHRSTFCCALPKLLHHPQQSRDRPLLNQIPNELGRHSV